MGVLEMIVAIVAITGATGVITEYLKVKGKQSGVDRKELQAELAAIRQEVAGLKMWANDLILGFDSTLHQQAARLQSLEQRALTPGSASPAVSRLGEAAQAEGEPLQIQTRA